MKKISKAQAKKFILTKQGLLGKYKFNGKEGCLAFVKQAGCIQFDPIDRCGKNVDLVLFSRVKSYQKNMSHELLYKTHELVDQWDKNMSIYHVEDWPYLAYTRQYMINKYFNHLNIKDNDIKKILNFFKSKTYIEAKDLIAVDENMAHSFNHKKASQLILDYLFFKGKIMIHHRQGIKRFYSLTNKHIDEELIDQNAFITIEAYQRYMIKRRIGAVGMLGDGSSDAYLGIYGMYAKDRRDRLAELLNANEILKITIEGLEKPYYILKEDEPILDITYHMDDRLEFIAPLDGFMWDRNLIKQIFDFEYKWEIYIPANKRKYGSYVLPMLFKDCFVGRIDMFVDSKKQILYIENIWFETQHISDKFISVFHEKINQFAIFNQCKDIQYSDQVNNKLSRFD